MASELSKALAGFKFEQSRVGILLSARPFPTLGEIGRAVTGDIRWVPHPMPPDEYVHWRDQHHRFLWEMLDEKFGNRADYRMWRLIARPAHASKASEEWSLGSDAALEALASSENVIVWGTLAVLSGLLTSKRLRELFSDGKSATDSNGM